MSEDELTGTRGYSNTGRPRGIGFPVETESTESDGYVIRGVEVEVHQKKDHPGEYGHYDATVRLTADVIVDGNIQSTIANLLDLAQVEVQAEIGRWLESIQEDRGSAIDPVPYPNMDTAPKGHREAPGVSGVRLPRGPSMSRDEFDAIYGREATTAGETEDTEEETVAQKMARVDTMIANEAHDPIKPMMTDEECEAIFGSPQDDT